MNFGRNQENNDTVQHEVDEIILQDNKNLSVKDETHEIIDYEFNEYELYELGKIILDQNNNISVHLKKTKIYI